VPEPEPTYAGFPACADLTALDADIAIVGVPVGVSYPGAEAHSTTAPVEIRRQSRRIGRFVDHHDFNFDGRVLGPRPPRIVDCGDVPIVDPSKQHAVTENVIRTIVSSGAVPIVLGGDHSIPIPVMRAFTGAGSMCVVQIDAHLDFRDEIHGIHDGLSSGMWRASELPFVSDLVQVGIRGVGSAREEDVRAAREYGSVIVLAADIHRHGIGFAIDRLPDAERYYVTLDIDGIDPSVAPGVIAPSFGGLSYFQVFEFLRAIVSKGSIVGMDIVEVAPARDINNITSLLAARLVMDTIGCIAHQGT
jgi:agmatinase